MSENTMMLVQATWQEKQTFRTTDQFLMSKEQPRAATTKAPEP